jgi:hypothetical protein
MRVGIHLGPVVAGVVGSRKFTFDVWGDTVNLAERLSSFGREPGIHLSAGAWRQVADRAHGDLLGPVTLKGKGEVEVIRCAALQACRCQLTASQAREVRPGVVFSLTLGHMICRVGGRNPGCEAFSGARDACWSWRRRRLRRSPPKRPRHRSTS